MYRSGQWNPDAKKGPPPPEMPGLGTAMLPLANKTTQSPHPSPPKDSPQSPVSTGKVSEPSMRGIKDTPLRTPSERWTISSTESQDFAMPISPQELIAQQNLNMMSSLVSNSEAGRPCSRAQSFDDFLRLHRLQEQGMPSQAMSAPSVISSLPQSSQQLHPTGIQSVTELVADSWATTENAHPASLQAPFHGESFYYNQVMETSSSSDGFGFESQSQNPVYDIMSDNDMSWQMFMNGLGL
jgi:hypothetical protein